MVFTDNHMSSDEDANATSDNTCFSKMDLANENDTQKQADDNAMSNSDEELDAHLFSDSDDDGSESGLSRRSRTRSQSRGRSRTRTTNRAQRSRSSSSSCSRSPSRSRFVSEGESPVPSQPQPASSARSNASSNGFNFSRISQNKKQSDKMELGTTTEQTTSFDVKTVWIGPITKPKDTDEIRKRLKKAHPGEVQKCVIKTIYTHTFFVVSFKSVATAEHVLTMKSKRDVCEYHTDIRCEHAVDFSKAQIDSFQHIDIRAKMGEKQKTPLRTYDIYTFLQTKKIRIDSIEMDLDVNIIATVNRYFSLVLHSSSDSFKLLQRPSRFIKTRQASFEARLMDKGMKRTRLRANKDKLARKKKGNTNNKSKSVNNEKKKTNKKILKNNRKGTTFVKKQRKFRARSRSRSRSRENPRSTQRRRNWDNNRRENGRRFNNYRHDNGYHNNRGFEHNNRRNSFGNGGNQEDFIKDLVMDVLRNQPQQQRVVYAYPNQAYTQQDAYSVPAPQQYAQPAYAQMEQGAHVYPSQQQEANGYQPKHREANGYQAVTSPNGTNLGSPAAIGAFYR